MGKAIAIFNQKGGVGKTTTNINLAACLARRGKKVLMVDIDPQGNTTSGIGIRKRTLKTTLYDALIDTDFDVRKAVLPTNTENLFLIPASVDLAGAEVELAQLEGRERRLKRVIDAVRDDYMEIDHKPVCGSERHVNPLCHGILFEKIDNSFFHIYTGHANDPEAFIGYAAGILGDHLIVYGDVTHMRIHIRRLHNCMYSFQACN